MHRELRKAIANYNSDEDIARTGGIAGIHLAEIVFASRGHALQQPSNVSLDTSSTGRAPMDYQKIIYVTFEPFTVFMPARYDYQHRFQRLQKLGYPIKKGYSHLSAAEAREYFLEIQREVSRIGKEKCPELLEGMAEYDRMTREGLLD